MADSEHVALIKRNIDSWNQWREINSSDTPDLSEADLRNADLCLANLRNADLSGASLIMANLTGADLRRARLRGANLVGARMIGVDLAQADLSGADLRTAEDLTDEQIAETHGNAATILPEGVNRPAHWTK